MHMKRRSVFPHPQHQPVSSRFERSEAKPIGHRWTTAKALDRLVVCAGTVAATGSGLLASPLIGKIPAQQPAQQTGTKAASAAKLKEGKGLRTIGHRHLHQALG